MPNQPFLTMFRLNKCFNRVSYDVYDMLLGIVMVLVFQLSTVYRIGNEYTSSFTILKAKMLHIHS